MVKSRMQERVLSFIREESLFRRGEKVVVAVSGGQDSVALLHLLFSLRHDLGISLIVAHYNHALRRSSGRDQLFVQRMAENMGLPFVTDTNSLRMPKNISVEEFARNIRYDFFRKAVRLTKADSLVVAHTKDDLAETVLMRILRGTGLYGLRAMLPRRELNSMQVVRPLLAESRLEVSRYISKNALAFVEDPTNRSLDYFRNLIRLRILPYLEKSVGRGVKSNLAGLAVVAAADYDLIDTQSRKIFKEIATKRSSVISLSILKLLPLHSALRRSLIRSAIADINGDLNGIGQEHIADVEQLALRRRPGMGLNLPKNIVVKLSATHITITRDKNAKRSTSR